MTNAKTMLHEARAFIGSGLLDKPEEPVAVMRNGIAWLAYDDERLSFYVSADGAIKDVQRLYDDDPLWPVVKPDDTSYVRVTGGKLAMLVSGAKRAIADGALPRIRSL